MSKKTSRFHITGPLWGEPPMTNGFSSQRASNAENIPMSWCNHASRSYNLPSHAIGISIIMCTMPLVWLGSDNIIEPVIHLVPLADVRHWHPADPLGMLVAGDPGAGPAAAPCLKYNTHAPLVATQHTGLIHSGGSREKTPQYSSHREIWRQVICNNSDDEGPYTLISIRWFGARLQYFHC